MEASLNVGWVDDTLAQAAWVSACPYILSSSRTDQLVDLSHVRDLRQPESHH